MLRTCNFYTSGMHLNKETIKKKISKFLKDYDIGVVSTVHTNGQGTESAVVGFAETADLEIIFGTSNLARKYKNIKTNPRISFVIGWSSKLGSLQYEGVARELTGKEKEEKALNLIAKNVGHKKYLALENQSYFLVEPTWIRFSDNAGDPPDSYEITL